MNNVSRIVKETRIVYKKKYDRYGLSISFNGSISWIIKEDPVKYVGYLIQSQSRVIIFRKTLEYWKEI